MAFKLKTCTHLEEITEVKTPKYYHCDECIKTGDTWVHLRTCQTCGTTLCCDSSPNKHASQNPKTHNHHVVASAEPNEWWLWCYLDKIFQQY
ncbi:MAG: UBP-type zinc finger domain-containing protein [Bacteroidota bacterium]